MASFGDADMAAPTATIIDTPETEAAMRDVPQLLKSTLELLENKYAQILAKHDAIHNHIVTFESALDRSDQLYGELRTELIIMRERHRQEDVPDIMRKGSAIDEIEQKEALWRHFIQNLTYAKEGLWKVKQALEEVLIPKGEGPAFRDL